MTVEVLIPFRGGCRWRERALDFVRCRYRWPVTIASAPAGPWCKANALMPAVAASCADVLVVADADVFTDGLTDAVDAVHSGAAWAVPHRMVHRLNQTGTRAVLAGADWQIQPLAQPPYLGFEGGGIVVIRRDVALDVPMPVFEGWGGEDESWAMALYTLAGVPWRGVADLVHLWHPPQRRMSRRWGSTEGRALVLRFQAARGNPAVMRELLEEVSPCRSPA